MKNIYFVILAKSKNDAGAIAEAHNLAKAGGTECSSVEVRTCGTEELIAHVFPDGAVGLAKQQAIDDSDMIQPPQVKELQECSRRLGDKLKARDVVIDDLIDLTALEINEFRPNITHVDAKLELARLRGRLSVLHHIRDLER